MRLRDKLKDFFIPCTENSYKPNVLEQFSVAALLILVLLTFALANVQALLWIKSDWLTSAVLPGVLVELTNDERGSEALGELRRNELLDRAATLKAQDMAQQGYFAHYSPEGVSPWHWFETVEYSYAYAGENLAVHFTDSSDVVMAWMKSPAHRANILNNTFTEIGIGTAQGEYKGFPTVFVVQLFGTPQVAEAASRPAPAESAPAPSGPVAVTEREELPTATGTVESATDEVVPSEIEPETITTPAPESEPVPEPPVLASEPIEIVVSETPNEVVVIESGLATTAAPGPILTVGALPEVIEPATEVGVLARLATQPQLWLQFIYAFLALFTMSALIIAIVVEWRRQNPIQIAYAGGLLVTMALLLHVHMHLTAGVVIM